MAAIKEADSPMCTHCLNRIDKCPCKLDGLPGMLRAEVKQNRKTSEAGATLNNLSVIERKAMAFDWFVKEMMDEELEILMKKGGYKTPLEAIEKAMIGEQEGLVPVTGDTP